MGLQLIAWCVLAVAETAVDGVAPPPAVQAQRGPMTWSAAASAGSIGGEGPGTLRGGAASAEIPLATRGAFVRLSYGTAQSNRRWPDELEKEKWDVHVPAAWLGWTGAWWEASGGVALLHSRMTTCWSNGFGLRFCDEPDVLTMPLPVARVRLGAEQSFHGTVSILDPGSPPSTGLVTAGIGTGTRSGGRLWFGAVAGTHGVGGKAEADVPMAKDFALRLGLASGTTGDGNWLSGSAGFVLRR